MENLCTMLFWKICSQLTLSDECHLERMFVIQVAIEDGGNMAKEVSLYQVWYVSSRE